MTILLKLAFMFSKLCVFAFGGGYVMIPIMLHELEQNNLASAAELTDAVAIAGISPGPIAVNAAVSLGYKVAGIPGTLAAFLGIVIPNALLVILVAVFFFKVCNHPRVKAAFYGLRPVIAGIILFAAVSFAIKNGIILPEQKMVEVKSAIIAISAFILMYKTKTHPIFVILGGGFAGILLFR